MALNYHDIEIKSSFSQETDPVYIFSGTILVSHRFSTAYNPGTSVICCVPCSNLELKKSEDVYIALVSEDFLAPKPQELSHEASVQNFKAAFRALNALHYSLSVLQNESIFIINPPDALTLSIAISLGLNVFYSGKEDFRVKALKVFDFPDSLIVETGGLGVNYVLDFSCSHTGSLKKAVIDCLGIRGKWAVCNEMLQLDPPESRLLFMRNASLCFFNENVWVFNGVEHGKFIHLMNAAVKFIKEGSEGKRS